MSASGGDTGPACSACEAALPSATARFCPACGTPAAAAPVRERRRTVTLLFTDVTGSTALGEQLDPEAYRGVMGRYFAVAKQAVEAHGGRVEKFVGDAVLAVFGVPEVREDDALRAVRAAHDLGAAVAELAADLHRELGVELTVRTGVNTGPVVAGGDRAGGSFATGDAVNTAARLEQAAGPGDVLLGEATYHLVRDAVTAEPVAAVVAKGKAEPVPAYRLLSVDADAPGRRRRFEAVLVGRDAEMRALGDALDRTVTTGRGHLVSVIGAPGIGKSRLVRDFEAQVGDRARVLRGRCVAYGQGITYWPLVQLVRDAAGLHGGESAEVVRHALDILLADARDADEVVDLLLPLLGVGGRSGDADQTGWAASRLLEQVALRSPVVLAVDDLHWAEPTLVELLERVADETRDLPVLLVCQARPELLDQHPSWGRGSINAVSLGLEPFAAADTAASLRGHLGGNVDDDLVSAIASWSGGNPLFVEEIATHLLERERLLQEDGVWRLVGDLATAGVPATVSALLTSRLERLPAAERELLEACSVIGLEFTTDQARHLAPGDGDPVPLLTALSRRDLLRRDRSGAGDGWAFRHVLIRDAAYDALAKSDRIRLHEGLADHLEAHPVDAGMAGGEQAGFVFHHRERAAAYAAELAPHDPRARRLADRAADAAYEAVELALDVDLMATAHAISDRARALPVGARRARRLALQMMPIVSLTSSASEHAAFLDRIASGLDDPGEPASELERVHHRMLALTLQLYLNDDSVLDELMACARRVADLAASAGDDELVIDATFGLYDAHGWHGRFYPLDADLLAGSRRAFVRRRGVVGLAHDMMLGPTPAAGLVAHARRHRTPSNAPAVANALDILALTGLAARDELDESRLGALTRDALALDAESLGGVNLQMVANAHGWGGEPRAAGRLLGDLGDSYVERGMTAWAGTYLLWGALLELDGGAPIDAMGPRIELGATHTSPTDAVSVALLASARALVATEAGNTAAALDQAAQAVHVIEGTGLGWLRPDIHRWMADVNAAAGDSDGERWLLERARELYADKGLLVLERRTADRLARLGD